MQQQRRKSEAYVSDFLFNIISLLILFLLGRATAGLKAYGGKLPLWAAIGVGLLAVVLAGVLAPKLRKWKSPRRLWATALNPSRNQSQFLHLFQYR